MATEKKYLSYDMLSLYDSKMKEHVADSDVETLQAAKTYAEELGDNYDASGSAATAESNANKYTDEQLATEKARAEAVEANLQEQINSVSGSANLEEIVNSINGFNEYMTEHGEVAEGFRIAIDANTQAIEALEETLVDGVTVSWNDLTDKPFGETITTVVSGSAVIPAGSTSFVTVLRGVGYVENKRRYIHDNAIIYGVIDGVKYYVEDVQSIANSTICLCTIDDCAINLSAGADRKTGAYLIQASVDGNLGRDLTIELFYDLLNTKTIDAKFLPEEAHSDWNQNDEKAPSYVKNRPMYYSRVEQKDATIFEVSYTADDLDSENESIDYGFTDIFTPVAAEQDWTYRAVVDGVTYEDLKPYQQSGFGASLVGSTDFSAYPFYLHFGGGSFMCGFATKEDHTVKFTADIPEIVSPLDEKWLPESVAKTTLRSTTEESTKKFDVTVDDEGNLSTTDVETGETKVISSGSGGGGVTSWNDLEDKPFYEESNIAVLYEASFDTTDYNYDTEIYLDMEDFPAIYPDANYTVEYNGVAYNLTAFSSDSEPGCVLIGDASLYPTEELPFVIWYSQSDAFASVCVNGIMIHTIKITGEKVVVHKLDSKYLDLPCYEIPSQKGNLVNEYEFNAEDFAQYTDNIWNGEVDDPYIDRGRWYIVDIDGVSYEVPYVEAYRSYIGDENLEQCPFCLYANGTIDFLGSIPHSMQVYELIPAEIVQLDPKFIPKEVQADWYENDCNSVSYVRNRPFYEETVLTPIFEGEFDNRENGGYYNFPYDHYLSGVRNVNGLVLEEGSRYCVKYNGLDYYLTATCNESKYGSHDIIWLAYFDLGSKITNKPCVPFSIGYDAASNELEYTFLTRDIHKLEISLVTDSIVHKIEPKYLTQPDWDEEDVNSTAYIHNKTHYIEKNRTVLADVTNVVMENGTMGASYNWEHKVNYDCFMIDNSPAFVLEVGRKYEVTFKDEVYELIGKQHEQDENVVYIGNPLPVLHKSTGEDADCLFAILQSIKHSIHLCVAVPCGDVDIKIVTEDPVVHTLDPKFLPMDDIAAAVLDKLPTWTGGNY